MSGLIEFVTNPKLWAYVVTVGLAAAQITATSQQTEIIVGGITGLLGLLIHKYVKGKEPKAE